MEPVRPEEEARSDDTHPRRSDRVSWLCASYGDRRRMLDMEENLHNVRRITFVILGAALIAGSPWVGLWPLLFLLPAAGAFAVAELMIPRLARPETAMFAAWLLSCGVIAVAVAAAGTQSDAAISWIAIP